MDAFIGEIKAFPYNFIPEYWLPCDGAFYSVSGEYQRLFTIISNYYGGDGYSEFAVPDLRGRVAVGVGADFPVIGLRSGDESVELKSLEMPMHNHEVTAYLHSQSQAGQISNTPCSGDYLTNGSTKIPDSLGKLISIASYSSSINKLELLNTFSVGASGGINSHENRQPYLAFRYCICYASDYYPIKPSI
jgi:microcystin-dependent protein